MQEASPQSPSLSGRGAPCRTCPHTPQPPSLSGRGATSNSSGPEPRPSLPRSSAVGKVVPDPKQLLDDSVGRVVLGWVSTLSPDVALGASRSGSVCSVFSLSEEGNTQETDLEEAAREGGSGGPTLAVRYPTYVVETVFDVSPKRVGDARLAPAAGKPSGTGTSLWPSTPMWAERIFEISGILPVGAAGGDVRLEAPRGLPAAT